MSPVEVRVRFLAAGSFIACISRNPKIGQSHTKVCESPVRAPVERANHGASDSVQGGAPKNALIIGTSAHEQPLPARPAWELKCPIRSQRNPITEEILMTTATLITPPARVRTRRLTVSYF